MIKSLSFNRPRKNPLDRDLAVHPTADKLLTWLEGVDSGNVLLLVSKTGDAEGPYVTGIPAKYNDMVISRPSRAMKGFRQLLKGLLPVCNAASDGVWQAALPLAELLKSDQVRRGGVRHTEALVGALRALSQAQQARRDRQDVALETARPGTPSGSGSLDDEAASSEAEPGSVSLTVLDMSQVWKLAAEGSLRRTSTSSSRLPLPSATGSNRSLVRRGQSFDLRHVDIRLSARKKDDAAD